MSNSREQCYKTEKAYLCVKSWPEIQFYKRKPNINGQITRYDNLKYM